LNNVVENRNTHYHIIKQTPNFHSTSLLHCETKTSLMIRRRKSTTIPYVGLYGNSVELNGVEHVIRRKPDVMVINMH